MWTVGPKTESSKKKKKRGGGECEYFTPKERIQNNRVLGWKPEEMTRFYC